MIACVHQCHRQYTAMATCPSQSIQHGTYALSPYPNPNHLLRAAIAHDQIAPSRQVQSFRNELH